MTTTREAKFKQGDLVKHRASGQRGVVSSCLTSCVNHSFPFSLCSMRFDKSECDFQFCGLYELSTEFQKDNIDVAEYLLDLCEQEDTQPDLKEDKS